MNNLTTTTQGNPFYGKSLKRRIGSPLYTTYKNGINELEERDRRCREEPSSKESRIFGDVFYLNMMRKELANEKLRSALCTISQSKYYRHDIKKSVKQLQIKIARWDSDIARCIATDSLIDMYDGLAEWTSEQTERDGGVAVYLTTEKPFRYEKDDRFWVGYPIATDSVSNVFREHVPSLGECVEVECKFHAEHETYIDRMEDELEELTNKVLKLDTFMGTETYEKLTMAEKILMTDQLKAMERYRDCLCDRLKNNNRTCR